MRPPYQKTIRIIFGTLLVYALLVATHLGEFWPFSIYPMFSQAGNPWQRAVVRDVTNMEEQSFWKVTDRQGLSGDPVPLKKLNINTNDIANLLSKTDIWTEEKIEGIRKLFSSEIESRELLLIQARGSLTEDDTVDVQFYPYIYLSRDTTILNNELKTQ